MTTARDIVLILLCYSGDIYCAYTEYQLLFLLSSEENVSPLDEWTNSNSSYNSNQTLTVFDLTDNGVRGYRNTFIDRWDNNPPDKVRLSFRNARGHIVFKEKFSSTGLSRTQWFSEDRKSGTYFSYELNHTHPSYTAEFVAFNRYQYLVRYRAACLITPNGTVKFINGASNKLTYLPATRTEPTDCYISDENSNMLTLNVTTTNQTHTLCSAICREKDYSQGAVHGEICSCLNETAVGPTVAGCSNPCLGNNQEMCGGTLPSGVLFNTVNTDVDASQFDKPLFFTEPVIIMGNGQISHPETLHMYGFNINISSEYLPISIYMELQYKMWPCSDTSIQPKPYETWFNISTNETIYTLWMDILLVECVQVYLYDNSTSNELTFPATMSTIALKEESFATLPIMTIEAAWLIVPPSTTSSSTMTSPSTLSTEAAMTTTTTTTTKTSTSPAPTPTGKCCCSCWVYNLLYGDSIFNNLSYWEIKLALKNVTEKLEKDLLVNKSTLSSTIRRMTSADDKRTSAAAVGYLLGVALLVTIIGGILIADFPKMIEYFKILADNLKSGFRMLEDGHENPTYTHPDRGQESKEESEPNEEVANQIDQHKKDNSNGTE